MLNFLGAAAVGLNAAQDESSRLFKEAMAESDAALKRAKDQMQGIQMRGQVLVDQGRDAEAAAMIPQMGAAFNKAYGMDLPTQQVHGTPVMARGMEKIPTEQLGPAMPGKLMPKVPVETPAPYQYDTGKRTFDLPEQKAAIRGGLLLPKEKPETFELSAGQTRYEQLPGQAPKAVASLDAKATKTAPKYVQSTDAAGKPIWVEAAPGIPAYEKPDKADKDTSIKEYNNAFAEWQQRGASYVNEYVSLMARNSQRTRVQNGITMTVPPTPEQMKAWREEGARAWRAEVNPPAPPGGSASAFPFGNPNPPGGGKAAPARRGQLNIAPPAKYEDTALLPEWESHVQAALKVAPGVEISSRARSKARNAQAKPGGGAPDSWHMHRQAFDVIKYNDAQKAKLREWARSEGLHMIDEGNHLHFQPARVSDAGQAPALVAFYEKHGIKPGAANA